MPKRVLLADDSVTIQRAVQYSLSQEDLSVILTSKVDEALQKMVLSPPDLILADTYMPGKNGYDLCTAVRGHPSLKTIPIILLASNNEPFNEDRARLVGATSWVAKPFSSQVLIDAIRNAFLGATTPAIPAAPAEPIKPAIAAPVIKPPTITAPPTIRPPVAPGIVTAPPAIRPPQMSAPTISTPAAPRAPVAPGISAPPAIRPPVVAPVAPILAASVAPLAAPVVSAPPQARSPIAPAAVTSPPIAVRPPPIAVRPVGMVTAPPAMRPTAPVPSIVPVQTLTSANHESLLKEALTKASREMIEKIIWEVVPELAETMIQERIAELVKAKTAP